MKQQKRYLLNLAGEFGVCSELAKRNILPNLTFGNYKSADILVINSNNKKSISIEVKTSNSKRIVTGFFQKYKTRETPHPDIWIVVQIDIDMNSTYYILTHEEMATIQMERNKMEEWMHIKGGVDNISTDQLTNFEGKWEKISDILQNL